jgi:alpha-L-fucosidase
MKERFSKIMACIANVRPYRIFVLFLLLVSLNSFTQMTIERGEGFLDLNKPERLEWLKDAGFGMFIHFSFDSQLGIVIGHSMAGASPDYLDRFVNDLPKTFNPDKFSAEDIAALAKLAGMKYMVLTTKHIAGFCLWDTKTTDFNIMNSQNGKDLVQEYVEACRKHDLAVGFYYCPEDFHFLHENGQKVRRIFPKPIPDDVMADYLDITEKQVTELMTHYGKIDVIFFDGGEGPLQEKSKEVVWRLQPDVLVTRGAISTPEQSLPGLASDNPWEACVTIGTQWQYKPTNEDYKSASRIIEILIESRAKGGTLLLNVGPKPNGELPIEQEERLREVAAWTFINQESIYEVRPWIITNEENIWFSKSKEDKTIYAYLTKIPDWPRGERKDFVLRSVESTEQTKISVLGQSGELVEYEPKADASSRFEQKEDGLHISVVRAQRIYNNHKWPNPIVVKIENVEPALDPPFVKTLNATLDGNRSTLHGELVKKGVGDQFEVGFMYKVYEGFAENIAGGNWTYSEFKIVKDLANFQIEIIGLKTNCEYEYRAVVRHPKIEVKGDIKRFKIISRN